MPVPRGKQHYEWKGDKVGYSALHKWVYRHKGRPIECEWCSTKSKVEWANISKEYKRDLDDYIQLCRKCHRKFDWKKGWVKYREAVSKKTAERPILPPNNNPKSHQGNKNPNAILDEVQIETIRKLYQQKSYSQIALGITFGVNQSTISRIVRGKRWNSIP